MGHEEARAFIRSCTSRLTFAAPLVASCNFSRQYAELIDVPIANEHLDSGCHCLTAGVPLGLASSLPRPQMLEFEHGGSCMSIVSHGPSPSQCRSLISAPNMAVRGRPLGAIWAAYLFVPNKKPRPGRMVGAPDAFIEINCACGGAKHGGALRALGAAKVSCCHDRRR